jgi:hypothetical protein
LEFCKPTFKADTFNDEHYVYERVGCEYATPNSRLTGDRQLGLTLPAATIRSARIFGCLGSCRSTIELRPQISAFRVSGYQLGTL